MSDLAAETARAASQLESRLPNLKNSRMGKEWVQETGSLRSSIWLRPEGQWDQSVFVGLALNEDGSISYRLIKRKGSETPPF